MTTIRGLTLERYGLAHLLVSIMLLLSKGLGILASVRHLGDVRDIKQGGKSVECAHLPDWRIWAIFKVCEYLINCFSFKRRSWCKVRLKRRVIIYVFYLFSVADLKFSHIVISWNYRKRLPGCSCEIVTLWSFSGVDYSHYPVNYPRSNGPCGYPCGQSDKVYIENLIFAPDEKIPMCTGNIRHGYTDVLVMLVWQSDEIPISFFPLLIKIVSG